MHNLREKFDKILVIVNDSLISVLNKHGNFPKPGKEPKFSDAKIIALSILSECLMYDSENYLFMMLHKNFHSQFPDLPERTRYNRRRRRLMFLKERVREYLVEHLVEGENLFVIDSMPIKICRFSRAKRIRVCTQDEATSPAYGYCAAQNSTYLGYKLHGVSTLNGVITTFDLSKANNHDIDYLKDIKGKYSDCTILGDRAYLSDPLQQELFEEYQLMLKTPMRINQKNYQVQPKVFRKVRKRIETVFSQFCDQFNIQRNYAKTFIGLATRILAKITGYTMLQYLNKFELNTKISCVKHALI